MDRLQRYPCSRKVLSYKLNPAIHPLPLHMLNASWSGSLARSPCRFMSPLLVSNLWTNSRCSTFFCVGVSFYIFLGSLVHRFNWFLTAYSHVQWTRGLALCCFNHQVKLPGNALWLITISRVSGCGDCYSLFIDWFMWVTGDGDDNKRIAFFSTMDEIVGILWTEARTVFSGLTRGWSVTS